MIWGMFAPMWEHPGGIEHNTLKFALNDSISKNHNGVFLCLRK